MKKNIIFVWHEIPTYAAYQLDFIIKKSQHNIYVVTNHFINKQIKKILKKNVFSLKIISQRKKINNIVLDKQPHVVFSSGWRYKYIQNFTNYLKRNNTNLKIVSMVDNNFKNNFRQKIGKIYFKFFLSENYDFFWVPGKSTKKLLNYYGVSKKLIFENLYNVNQNIFFNKINLHKRKNNFIFVGQCIKRKNFDILARSFIENFKNKNIRLIVITNTSKRKINKKYLKNRNIRFYFNLTSKEISNKLNQNKFFILPSKVDHWPLALLEAISTGNICIVSKNLGNIYELGSKNLTVIKEIGYNSIKRTFNLVNNYSKKKLNRIVSINKKLSKKYYLNNFYITFKNILKNCE